MSNYLLTKRNPLVLIILIAFLHVQCGSYQGTSYYYADGIYTTEIPENATRSVATDGSQNYYKQYFNNLSDDNGSYVDDPTVITDVDSYSSAEANGYQTVNNQPWGAQTQRTDIYIYDNTRWGFNSWNWGFNSWGFNDFYWWNRPFNVRPYWGWNFYSPFYSPFYDPFLDFHYGNRWAFSNFGRPFYYGSQFGNRYWNRNVRVTPRRNISQVTTRRGEKGYDANRRTTSNSVRGQQASETKNSSLNLRTVSRFNVGRSLPFLGNVDKIPTNITAGSNRSNTASTPSRTRFTRVPSGRQIQGNQTRGTSTNRQGRTVRYNSSTNQTRSNTRYKSRPTNSRQNISSGRSYSGARSSGRSSSSSRSNGGRRN